MSSAKGGERSQVVIAIDGPAGSGKSTVARLAAKALGFDYVDTGAMYRAVTYAALQKEVDLKDVKRLEKLAKAADIRFARHADGSEKVIMNGRDVTLGIRMPDVTANVSAVSANPKVREALVEQQRKLAGACRRGAVVEGRDVGTVVFPKAMMKIYLDASIATRAKRRQKDMANVGVEVDDAELVKLLAARDEYDSTRAASPLAQADDAVIIDTTDMTIEESVGLVVRLAQEKEGAV